MRKQLSVLLVVIASLAAVASAQNSSGEKPVVVAVIGCLQRGPLNIFTLKDYRSNVTYRIDADAEAIGWHVGHELEIHGPVSEGRRVKAEQVVFIADHCAP